MEAMGNKAEATVVVWRSGRTGVTKCAPHREASWSRFNFSWGRFVQTTERYLGSKQRIRSAVNDRIGVEPNP
jgi:hypothetical protein